MTAPGAPQTSAPATQRAELAFHLASEAEARAVAGALAVEAAEGPEGASTAVRREGATIHVSVASASLSDLRAALNSVVRLLDAAARTAQAGTPRA